MKKLRFSDLSYNSIYTKKIAKKKKLKDYVYCLPFKPGNAYLVSQTQGRTHKGRGKYAVDFVIPTGAGVHAARAGIVIQAQDIFTEAGGTKEFLNKANYILVEHDDGTYAMYAHLDFQGTKVSEGDFVKLGQHIGYSGNTGYSNGAHLHFEVLRSLGQKGESIPLAFWTKSSLREKLRVGRRYFASRDCLLR